MSTEAGRRPSMMREFFTIWGGQVFSLLGSQVVQFALIWYLTRETGSATVLALASLAGMLPGVVLGPIAGALVDRWPRRWVMVGADAVVAAATLLLAALFAWDLATIWHIYAILFVRSLAGTFHYAAMQASTALMVPPGQLTRVAGLNQALNGGLNILSAPMGALLVETLAMPYILAIDAATALIAILPLLFIAVPQPQKQPESDDAQPAGLWRDVRVGFAYIWASPGLRLLVLLAVILNFLLPPAFSLLPLLISDYFGRGALELGWVNSATGLGIIAGGVALGAWGGFRRRMVTTLAGLILLGLGTFGFGLIPPSLYPLSIVAGFAIGLAIPITNGPMQATMQAVVDPAIQGRVFTTLGSLSTAMTPVSLLVAGPLSDLVDIRIWYLVAGIVCLALASISFFVEPVVNLGYEPEAVTAVL